MGSPWASRGEGAGRPRGAALDMLAEHGYAARDRMTYSIAALDPETGELGVAVQTGWPSVGAIVPWVEPGVGAVATQSFTNVGFGPEGLARMRAGQAAPDVLPELVADDPLRDARQVGMVDSAGRAAAHTGSRCVAEAGQVCAEGVSIQGNSLERVDVWLKMLDAFRSGSGDLADRLLAALQAGEREGGDIRGRLSAALLVAPGSPGAAPWARRFDLRIDSSTQPLVDLARLLRVARAYEALDAAMEAIEAGDLEVALTRSTVAHRLEPEDAQVAFWHGVLLLESERPDEARPVLDAALRSEPRLAEFGDRFARAGHGAALADVLGQAWDATQAAPRANDEQPS